MSNVALAFCLASYASTTEPTTHKVITSTPKSGKVRVTPATNTVPANETMVDSGKREAAPVAPRPTMPVKGTLDPKGFLVALNRAKDLAQRQEAIAAYVGYNFLLPYGPQEDGARKLAQKALKPYTPAAFSRGTTAPTNGVVSGLPDHTARHVANLKAREVASVEAMLSHDRLAAEASDAGNVHGWQLHGGLAQVERERLDQIRKDLAAMPESETSSPKVKATEGQEDREYWSKFFNRGTRRGRGPSERVWQNGSPPGAPKGWG